MDSWYTTMALFKWVERAGKICYCPLKSNRLVDERGGPGTCEPLGLLSWSAQDVVHGKVLKVRGMPKESKLKVFRVLVSTHRTDYLVTNELAQQETAAAEAESGRRWTMEQFHREAKYLTGLEACQCRLARSQRNHIGLALRVWFRLKTLAYRTNQTVYQLKAGLLNAYMKQELSELTLAFA